MSTGSLTDSVTSWIAGLRLHAGPDQHVVLIAGTVTNAEQIGQVHGAAARRRVEEVVVERLASGPRPVAMVEAGAQGGFVAAAVVDADLAHTQAERIAEQARGLVDLDGGTERVWPVVSVGLRVCDDDAAVVLRDVMATLLTATRVSPGANRWFDAADTTGPRRDLELVRDLCTALQEHPEQLQLAYQPVVDLRDRRVTGAEGLLRWLHPTAGPVSPLAAVAAAERTGLIGALGRHVLDVALAQVAAWSGAVDPGFRMHVNVSMLELRDPGYVDHVEAALAHHGAEPSTLLLEITETALVEDRGVRSRFQALRRLGVGTGMDDFGTGYSTLAHLRNLAVDTVKIDRSLVSGVGASAADFERTRALLGLVGDLGVTMVAEGVETAVEAAHLRAMGCVLGQGYHLGRPAPAAAFPTGPGGPVTSARPGGLSLVRSAGRGAPLEAVASA